MVHNICRFSTNDLLGKQVWGGMVTITAPHLILSRHGSMIMEVPMAYDGKWTYTFVMDGALLCI